MLLCCFVKGAQDIDLFEETVAMKTELEQKFVSGGFCMKLAIDRYCQGYCRASRYIFHTEVGLLESK